MCHCAFKLFHVLLIVFSLFLSAKADEVVKFGVGLTTIPPRFQTVHHVVASWLAQQTPPEVIIVFVPERYQNFVDESPRDKTKNIMFLKSELAKHFPEELESGKIIVQPMKKDWGPITKYVGLLEHFEDISSKFNVGYWAIGDDDVRYSDNTLSDYAAAIADEKSYMSISTHFKMHPRVQVNMGGGNVKQIMHLQGVDTVLFPTALLRKGLETGKGINFDTFTDGVKQFHATCPNSYFQDDYIMSFLVAMSGEEVKSIWSGQKVAHHVNSVSKSNQQMHIHPQVFEREDETKNCIAQHGREIFISMERKRNNRIRDL